MSDAYVITIGRQLGSGGRIIGEKLASHLGISFYDKELIQIASQESGLGKEFFERADEKKGYSVFGGLFGLRGMMTEEPFSTYYLNNETLFTIQSDVIRKVADQGSCLFVGRCADYVLAGRPRLLNIYITANLDDRIKRIAERDQVTEKKAKDIVEKADKDRAGYYNYFTNKKWGAAESYHLCINSSVLGIEETVGFIKRFAEKRFGLE
ncbi:MAG TPA: cytidylate kinase-like family protein [Bacteroidales bacterium]|jgi:cytidylate kinase|nr:cytidylate kinase-like family protein [Bacteroidales bacterium]